jgi:hypothetical protein
MWPHHVWPVLAGTVIAVGVVGAFSAFGVVGLLLGYVTLSLFAVVVVWGLSQEFAIDRSTVVRLGLEVPLGVLVLLGLCVFFPRTGLVIAAVVALGSPRALGLVARLRRRLMRRSVAANLGDPVVLDRRFDEIVSQLRQSGDVPES